MVRITRGANEQPNVASKRGGAAKARAAAAAGFVATVGGVGAFGATDAQAKIFACYSKSTGAVKHATSSHCPHGYKSFSWNAVGVKGPQGAQGAAGARGAQGAQGAAGTPGLVAGYDKYKTTSTELTESTSTVVTSFAPAAAGNYAVNAVATLQLAGAGSGTLKCNVRNLHDTSATPVMANHVDAETVGIDVANTGIIHASPASPVQEVCSAQGTTHGYLYRAELTGVQLATANGAATALHENAAQKSHRPANSYTR